MFARKFSVMVFAALVILTGCNGCTQLGLSPAKSFNDRVGYAVATHTAVLNATTAALNAKAITSDDARAVAKLADESRALIDAARAAEAGADIETANGRLILATNILIQLQTYLNTHGGIE